MTTESKTCEGQQQKHTSDDKDVNTENRLAKPYALYLPCTTIIPLCALRHLFTQQQTYKAGTIL